MLGTDFGRFKAFFYMLACSSVLSMSSIFFCLDKRFLLAFISTLIQAIFSIGTLFYLTRKICVNSEEKEILESDQAQSRAFSAMFLNSPYCLAVVDQRGVIEKVNRAFETYLGYDAGELGGKYFDDITFEEDLAADREFFKQLASGKIEFYQMEKRYKSKTGSIKWGVLHVYSVRSTSNKFLYCIGQVQDATKMKSTIEYMKLMLQVSDLGTWSWDLETGENMLDDRAKEIYGRSCVELVTDLEKILHPKDKDRVAKSISNVLNNQVVDYKEKYRVIDDNKDIRYVQAIGKRTSDNMFLGVIADITESETTIQKLKESNQQLEQFAYVTSHDLKTPLRGIINLISFITEELEKEDVDHIKVKEYSDLLSTRTSLMNSLIEGILEYSRIGRMDTEPEIVDVNEVIDEIVRELGSEQAIIEVEDLPKVRFNRIRIFQIFQNLISNAVNHNPDVDLMIKIGSYYREDDFLIFFVEDNGVGIAEEYRERVFEMFKSLKPKTSTSTGLGLAMVKKIVESFGGKIWITPDEDKCRFEFSIIPKNIAKEG